MLLTRWAVVLSILSPSRQLPTLALTGSFFAALKANTPPTQTTIRSTTTPTMMPMTLPAPPFFLGGGTGGPYGLGALGSPKPPPIGAPGGGAPYGCPGCP